MRNVISLLALLVCLGFICQHAAAGQSQTQSNNGPYLYQGVDITPVVELFRTKVRTLKRSITIYNWAPGSKHPFWQQDLAPDDWRLVERAQVLSESFWQNFGSRQGSFNMYGYGLYAALDPVATISFGLPDWVLLEMRLPVGFKMLDLQSEVILRKSSKGHRDDSAEQEVLVLNLMSSFGCSNFISAYSQFVPANSLFTNGGYGLSNRCRDLVRHVFRDILQIDGFAYPYGSTSFQDCETNFESANAIVITNPNWITSENVRFYTEYTRYELDRRTLIQTLFLENKEEGSQVQSMVSDAILTQLKNKPNQFVKGSATTCSGSSCIITIQFCDTKSNCDSVDVGPLPRKGGALITSIEAAKRDPGKLLWPDLEGKPKATTVKTWLKANKMGCSSESVYSDSDSANQK